jgi:serine/threonine protein kinase
VIDWEYALPTTINDVFRGTPYYMAPEGLTHVYSGPHGDVWSLGVILYEMYTEKIPFNAENFNDLCSVVKRYDPNYNHPKLPRIARKLLKKIFVPYSERIVL